MLVVVDKVMEAVLLVGSKEDEGNSNNSSSSNEEESQKNDYEYKMIENSILVSSKTPDWDGLTKDIELIYSDWAVITLDLYKQNIDNQKILSFNIMQDFQMIKWKLIYIK